MSDIPEQQSNTASTLAKDILSLARNSLIVNFRYLDRAVSHLDLVEDEIIYFETDGSSLFYNPWFILSQYKSEQSVIARNYLHSLLHCVFCHSYIGQGINKAVWDLACDIAVENSISDLNASCVKSQREKKQYALTSLLKDEIGVLTAERIYKWLIDHHFSDEELDIERENFKGDSHSIWYGEYSDEAKINKNIKLRKIWEDVSKRMQTELEIINKANGALVQNLKALNRSKLKYSDFLRKFTQYSEVMKLSEEEYDNNYYVFGLDSYGNMPLIEPLEYSEQRKIREFVIAIDTSGSVKGDIVQKFIEHTYNMLIKSESFFRKINVYIIQCDCIIRDVVNIKNTDDFEHYVNHLELKGFSETDFRPVFEYVDNLVLEGKLRNLKGLLYFTDGLGIFPKKPPKYDTAFIIHKGNYDDPVVPDWAMHMTLLEDDIRERKFSS